MIQTTDGGLECITNSLQRVRELLVQAGGATIPEDKETIKKEIGQMLNGIDNMANNTEFNGVKLLASSGMNPSLCNLLSGGLSKDKGKKFGDS